MGGVIGQRAHSLVTTVLVVLNDLVAPFVAFTADTDLVLLSFGAAFKQKQDQRRTDPDQSRRFKRTCGHVDLGDELVPIVTLKRR